MTAQTLKTMTHSLDAWLWRRGIGHPVIRPLVRNELLLTALFLLGGGAAFSATPWFFWFGEYSTAFLRVVLLRWGGRLLLLGGLLYWALIVCKAPVTAILGGLTAGAATALITFAVASRNARR